MAHIHEKIDFTASVYVVRDGKVLLHKHKKLGIWLPPGGHIELDEDPNQTAVREVAEETGLVIELVGRERLASAPADKSQDLLPPMFLNRHHVNEAHEHVDHVYFALSLVGDVRSEEGSEFVWVGRDQIEQNIVELLDAPRAYALAALDYFAK